MQVRTFTGPSSNSVLAQVKAEMGPDAVILSSREVKENGRVRHEITAGLDRKAAQPAPEAENGRNSRANGATAPAPSFQDAPQAAPPGWDEWHRDWNQIKEHLLALMKPGIRLESLSPRQRLAVDYLVREGMDDQTLLRLYRSMDSQPDLAVLDALTDLVPVRPWSMDNWPQEIQVLAGPSGSGKSTSALRMALALRAEEPSLPVLLLNADCERGHGRLLLRHYADLSGMEYAEAATGDDVLSALRAFGSENGPKSRVIVDLPAAPRGGDLAGQLEALGLTGSGVAVHIVSSPLFSGPQQAEFLRRYQCGRTQAAGIVWTKLDEAGAFGAIVNTGAASGLPVVALSFGAGLTDTLVPAFAGHVWRLVFKHQLPQAGAARVV